VFVRTKSGKDAGKRSSRRHGGRDTCSRAMNYKYLASVDAFYLNCTFWQLGARAR
jgi:hypothetical protein